MVADSCPGRSAARSSCEAVRCRAGAQLACLTGVPVQRSSARALHRARDTPAMIVHNGNVDHCTESLMSLQLYLAFVAACIALALLPGPVVTLVIANGLRHGTRAALINMAGVQAGLAIVIGIVAVGL